MKPPSTSRQMTQSWHFACHACGACCNSPPALTFEELGDYANDFHLRLAFQALPMRSAKVVDFPWGQQAMTPQQMAKMKENEKRLWNAVKGPDGIVMIHIFPLARAVSSATACPKRTDAGLCSIHDRRPLMCRTVPLAPGMPEFVQGMAITAFEEWGCASRTPKEGFEHLFNGFKLMPGGYRDAWERTRQSMTLDKDMSMSVMALMEEGYEHLPTIADVAGNPGHTASVSIAGAVLAGVLDGIVSKEDAIQVLGRQVAVMNGMLETTTDTNDARILYADIEACDDSTELIAELP